MKYNKMRRIISLISAIALLFTSFSVISIFTFAQTSEYADFDLQSIVDASNIIVSNNTTQTDFETALKDLELKDGYTVETVTDFYRIKSISGAVDITDPENIKELVPGFKGYVSAIVSISDSANKEHIVAVTKTIEPDMAEYTFASVSVNSEFMLDDGGKTLIGYTGSAEKVVIPEGVTTIKAEWAQYSANRDIIKCVIFPESLEGTVPDAWSMAAVEVIGFKGNKVTAIGYRAFSGYSSLKYLEIPEGVTSLGEQALNATSSLKTVKLPSTLVSIGYTLTHEWNRVCGLEELTIPYSVTNIGGYAFLNPSPEYTSRLTINLLNPNATIGAEAFKSSSAEGGAPLLLRTYGAAYDAYNGAYDNTSVEDISDMSLAEAVANIAQKQDEIRLETFKETSVVLDRFSSALYGTSAIQLTFENEEWTEKSEFSENYLLITKQDVTVRVGISAIMVKPFQLQGYVDKAALKFSNSTDSTELLDKLKSLSLPEGYSVKEIVEFYKLNFIEGAVDATDTSKKENLVDGVSGYIAAIVKITTPTGEAVSEILSEIQPVMEEYSFASVSVNSEFMLDDGGKTLVGYTGSAEKVVIPEGVTFVKEGWTQYSSNKSKIRCVVYPESLEGTLPDSWSLPNVQVVSFKGNKVTVLGYRAFSGYTSLKHLEIPEGVTSLGEQALNATSSLKTVKLPSTLTSLGYTLTHEWDCVCGLEELTIPYSVTKIDGYAFLDPSPEHTSRLTITLLNPNVTLGAEAFKSSSAEGGAPLLLRTYGAAYDAYNGVYDNTTVFDLNDMTVTEAATRVASKVTKINGNEFYGIDEIELELGKEIGFSTGISFSWKNQYWKNNDGIYENVLVISKDGYSYEFDFTAIFGEIDIQQAVNNAVVNISNDTTEAQFTEIIKGILPAGYTLEEVTQYYKHRAIDGAKDDTGILVNGHSGYISAVIKAISPDGSKAGTITVIKKIEPVIKEFTFNSVSSEADFIIENGVLKSYTGFAEKVVIPEGVIALAEGWISEENAAKCIVYPESLEGTVPAQIKLINLQVVCFKGDKVTTLGKDAFFKATSLEYIELPSGLETIEDTALATGPNSTDVKLRAIYLPEGLKYIGNNAFYWNSDDWNDRARQGFVDITIPSTVTSIGTGAFYWPQNIVNRDTFSATILNADTAADSAFAYEFNGAKIVIRASKDSSVYNSASSSNGFSVFALEEMSLAEATARANSLIDELKSLDFDSDVEMSEIAVKIEKSYGGYGDFELSWKLDSWDKSTDGILANTLIISSNSICFEIPVSLRTEPQYTLDDLTEQAEKIFKNTVFTNDVTNEEIVSVINSKMPGGYKVSLSEFYKIKAINGAKDKSGVLVAGNNGSVSAIIDVTDFYGSTAQVACVNSIKPQLETYKFASTSSKDDFWISDDGKTLYEYYGTAEKVVIPDGVETIAYGWMWGDPTVIKALVLPESFRSIPANMCQGMRALEIVSMGDNIVTSGEEAFAECYSLRYIHLSDNLEEISAGMFKYTYSLFSLHIPDSVVYIGNNAFLRASLRDIVVSANVEEVGDFAFGFPLDNSRVSISSDSQWYPIDKEVEIDVKEWVNANSFDENGNIIERTVTLLCSDETPIGDSVCGSGDGLLRTTVRGSASNILYKEISKILEENPNFSLRYGAEILDMSATEAVARAQVTADNLILYNDSSADIVKQRIEKTFVSTALNNNSSWVKKFTKINASATKNGMATGSLRFDSSLGKFAFEINISSVVYAVRPERLVGDSGDIWGDGWDDVFFDDFDDGFGDDLDDILDDDVVNDVDLETKPDSNKKPQANKSDAPQFHWVWIIIAVVIVALIVGILFAFVLMRKKKNEK